MSKQRPEWKQGISHDNIRRRRGSLPDGAVRVGHWCTRLRNSLLLPRLHSSGGDRHSRNNATPPGPCSDSPVTIAQIRESSMVWRLLLPMCIRSVLLIIQFQFFGSPHCSIREGHGIHSSILAWRIPWTEEPGGLQVHGVAKSQTWLSD